jgi:hypothetical protein
VAVCFIYSKGGGGRTVASLIENYYNYVQGRRTFFGPPVNSRPVRPVVVFFMNRRYCGRIYKIFLLGHIELIFIYYVIFWFNDSHTYTSTCARMRNGISATWTLY